MLIPNPKFKELETELFNEGLKIRREVLGNALRRQKPLERMQVEYTHSPRRSL